MCTKKTQLTLPLKEDSKMNTLIWPTLNESMVETTLRSITLIENRAMKLTKKLSIYAISIRHFTQMLWKQTTRKITKEWKVHH